MWLPIFFILIILLSLIFSRVFRIFFFGFLFCIGIALIVYLISLIIRRANGHVHEGFTYPFLFLVVNVLMVGGSARYIWLSLKNKPGQKQQAIFNIILFIVVFLLIFVVFIMATHLG